MPWIMKRPTVFYRCANKKSCTVEVNNGAIGGDPCVNTYKYMQVQYSCDGMLFVHNDRSYIIKLILLRHMWCKL